jgi:23S rRNA C2498 (ribose-2'-O)-methylase RlmM
MTQKTRQHIVLMRPGFEETLKDEFSSRFAISSEVVCRAGVAISETVKLPKVADTVFARQVMPRAMLVQGTDDLEASKIICDRIDVMTKRGNRQSGSWTLHGFAIDDDDGLARATRITKMVMAHVREKQKEFLKRYVTPDVFATTERLSSDILLQIYVPAKDSLWFSSGTMSDGVSVWEAGFQRMKTLRGAPSRSASKLEEALSCLGVHPADGETAVDLGAAPGGWSFVLARHGARVQAVDHAALDIKNMSSLKGTIIHVKDNGLKFMPPEPVDWMVCDMVMGARDTLSVLKAWHEQKAMRNFVVNVKLPKNNPWPQVSEALDLIETFGWAVARGRHLLHDRSEITLVGRLHT